MENSEDVIVEIPEAREKFFGRGGKMLLPCPATVAAAVRHIPAGRLATTDALRRALAEQFDVQETCPVAMKKALQAVGRATDESTPYWRVIKKNGELLGIFPGGAAGQAARLEKEGFSIDSSKKALKVTGFAERLAKISLAGGS